VIDGCDRAAHGIEGRRDILIVRRPVADREAEHGAISPSRAGHPDDAVRDQLAGHGFRAEVRTELPANLGIDDILSTSVPSIWLMPAASAWAFPTSRSTSAATPDRPSDRNAAQTGTPRARRDISGTVSNGSGSVA
jgi:hypothetical protein